MFFNYFSIYCFFSKKNTDDFSPVLFFFSFFSFYDLFFLQTRFAIAEVFCNY